MLACNSWTLFQSPWAKNSFSLTQACNTQPSLWPLTHATVGVAFALQLKSSANTRYPNDTRRYAGATVGLDSSLQINSWTNKWKKSNAHCLCVLENFSDLSGMTSAMASRCEISFIFSYQLWCKIVFWKTNSRWLSKGESESVSHRTILINSAFKLFLICTNVQKQFGSRKAWK